MTNGDWNQDVRKVVLRFAESEFNRSTEAASGGSSSSAPVTTSAVTESSDGAINTGAISSTSNVDNQYHVAGDVATVYPINDAGLVTRMLSILRANDEYLDADSVLSIKCLPGFVKRKSRLKQVDCIRLGRLFSSFIDIAGLPQRGFFEGLAQYATNDEEKEKLVEISSAEGTDLYYDYCIKEKRNYVEVLEDFRSVRPPLSRLLELLPVLQPRHYSIANSGLVCAAEVHLCVAVTSSKTPYGRVRVGLCSGYLSSLSPGDQVMFWLRSGSFKLPVRSAGAEWKRPPMILVGPGTGVAPMRALIQERRTVYDSCRVPPRTDTLSESNTILFFGCRSRDNDFLYSEEWPSNNAVTGDPDVFNGPSETMVVAFSRDQPQKIYVTDKIKEHGLHVWKLLCDVSY
jgi:sulfite reductase alpha subunit-like flavoprotein